MRLPSVTTTSLLRMALLGSAAALALADISPAIARVGVTSATDGDPLGKPPTEPERVLRIGVDVQANELITTRANDRAHLLFLDGTSLTVGPNAQLTIDRYVFDPATKSGDLAINATKGVFRLVGGKISKEKPITVATPASAIGIRGGIVVLDVDASKTASTFVFGRDMTVSAGNRTERVTRPGSQVVTSLGGLPGRPTLVAVGALDGALAQLEGNPRPATQASRSSGNADQKAESSGFTKENSGQGAAPSAPKTLPTLGRGADNLQSQITDAISNRNVIVDQQQATLPEEKAAPAPAPAPAPVPTVIVTQGRFLQDPPYSSFNRSTIAATRDPLNNQALAPTAPAVKDGIATITTADGRTFVVPWVPGQSVNFNGVTVLGNGPANGFVSPNGDFFAYKFTTSDGKTFGFFGGTPTTADGLPKSGFGAHTLNDGRSGSTIPFAGQAVMSDAQINAAANISPLYSAYSAQLGTGLPAGVPVDQRSLSLQVTVSIAGEGASQKSYLGQFIGTYYADYNSNTYFNAGSYQGVYRAPGMTYPGRFASAEATADTPQGNAIYGPNGQYMVFIPDSVTSSGDGTSGTTVRISQASQNLPNWANTSATPYYPITVAQPTATPPGVGETRTTRTMNGYVGGIFERISTPGTGLVTSNRLIDVSASQPTDLTLRTVASTNRAQATIVVRNLDAPGVVATFELGTLTGALRSTSVFIDDKRYALADQAAIDPSRPSRVQPSGSTSAIPIWGRTQLTSYNAAPVALPGGVTPCECAFMSWGWWTGEVQYFNPNNTTTGYNLTVKDRLNLASYVVGTLTNAVQLPNTGTATYTGHAIGNVVNGAAAYVAAGTYSNSWNFASQTGQVRIGNLDSTTYTGQTALKSGTVNFTGPISGGGRIGTLNGSFFSGPGDPVKGQGGNFAVSGPNYKAGGIFAGQK